MPPRPVAERRARPAGPGVGYDECERLRRQGPLRTVSRAVLGKGHAGLLEALPDCWSRPAEVVLARADFEFVRGETDEAMAACHRQQQRRPDVVRLLPALPWHGRIGRPA